MTSCSSGIFRGTGLGTLSAADEAKKCGQRPPAYEVAGPEMPRSHCF